MFSATNSFRNRASVLENDVLACFLLFWDERDLREGEEEMGEGLESLSSSLCMRVVISEEK